MISEMPLLKEQRGAFPQLSRAIYCWKVIICLYLKGGWRDWRIPCLNVGLEPETAKAQGGAGSHSQSFFKKSRSQLSNLAATLFSLGLVSDLRRRDARFGSDFVKIG